jgi:TRAP transporter TAXI family solute receptor
VSSRGVLDSHRAWRPGSWSWPTLLAVLFLAAASAIAAPAPNRVYTLASGSAQGVYLPLARDIATVAGQAGVEIRVLPSEGSRQNLAWLAEGRADLALAQSDVAWEAYTGHGGFRRPLTGLRAIAPLYTEAVHILIHRPLYVHRIEDLRGKRVAVGPAGSGTEANASQVLAAAGLTIDEVAARHLSLEEAVAAMRRGELDAAFVTSGVPSAAVAGVLADGSASLFEPDQDLMDRLQEALPFFLNKNVEPADYPGLGEQVTTVGVQALLVGRGDLPEAMVDTLVHALSSNRKLRAKYRLSGLGAAAGEAAIPTFGPARRYYAIQSVLRRRKLILGILGGLLVLALAAARFQGSLWRLFRRDDFIRVGVYFSVVWIAGSLALYWLEHRVNDNYSTLWKSMWSGLITVYSLSGKEPLTFEGRVVGIIIYLLGVAGLVWLTEKLASFYVEKKIIPLFRSGFARMHKMKDHYVIAGWNEKGPGIVAQLHGEDLNERRLIVILAKEDQTDLPSNGLVHTERGERASEAALRRVNVQAAHSVIVLAEGEDPAADARTILAILAVRKICSEQHPAGQVPVIAEILDPKNVSLATFAGGEGGGTLEIVSSHEMGQGLLTQAAVHPGLSSVFRQLLKFGKGDSEIHRVRVPERFVRKNEEWSFDRLARWSLEQRSKGVDVIPIAIQRGQEVHINPGSGNLDLLQEGDFLFAICDSPRELEKLYQTAVVG